MKYNWEDIRPGWLIEHDTEGLCIAIEPPLDYSSTFWIQRIEKIYGKKDYDTWYKGIPETYGALMSYVLDAHPPATQRIIN